MANSNKRDSWRCHATWVLKLTVYLLECTFSSVKYSAFDEIWYIKRLFIKSTTYCLIFFSLSSWRHSKRRTTHQKSRAEMLHELIYLDNLHSPNWRRILIVVQTVERLVNVQNNYGLTLDDWNSFLFVSFCSLHLFLLPVHFRLLNGCFINISNIH